MWEDLVYSIANNSLMMVSPLTLSKEDTRTEISTCTYTYKENSEGI